MVDLALLKPGDEVLLPDNVYNPSRELARHWLAPTSASAHRFYDPMDGAALAALIQPKHEADLDSRRPAR